jgi:selenocysteine lyase/cysteine desulfurase
MTDRRAFLVRSSVALGSLALPLHALAQALPRVETALGERPDVAASTLATDEAFWAEVRAGFDLDPGVVNLDHGWTNPAPRAAMDTLTADARRLESLPAVHLPGIWEQTTTTRVRAAIAQAVGVPGEQLALLRNATEALDTVLLGFALQRGDEVVCCKHDYYAMLDALEQRRQRDGVVLRWVDLPVPAPSMDAIVDAYAAAIGPKTRLVLLTHPSNLTGQLLPVRRIADVAHAAGAKVVVDGAQSLGLLRESPAELGADFYGASMHKWLGAPVGMGVLWMRPEHVDTVWPLIPSAPGTSGMGRFEWIGTGPEYISPSLLPALALHARIGAERKQARLQYLATLVRDRIRATVPDARFYTLPAADMRLGLTTVDWPGIDAAALQRTLLDKHHVLVQAMAGQPRTPHIRGIRISPNVYTSVAELDRFATALAGIVRR